jgi:hypothetical protein
MVLDKEKTARPPAGLFFPAQRRIKVADLKIQALRGADQRVYILKILGCHTAYR